MSSASKATGSSGDQKKPRQDVTKNKGKVGDWVRHTSSSGKEYYYNVITHASQWEKPKEWLEHEQRHGPVPNVPAASSSRVQPTGSGAKVQHSSSTNNPSQQQHDRERDREHHQQLHQQQQREREAAQRDRYHPQHHPYRGGTNFQQQPSASSAASNTNSTNHSHTAANSSGSGSYTNANSWNATSNSSHHQQQHHANATNERQAPMSYGAHSHNPASGSSSNSIVASTSSSAQSQSSNRTHYMDNRPSSSVSSMHQSARESRLEDAQSEDMDISPLEDESAPTETPTRTQNSHGQSQSLNNINIPGPSPSTYGNRNLERERERDRDRDRERDRDRDRGDDRDRESYRNYQSRNRDPRDGARKDRERNDRGSRRDQDTRDQRDKERERSRTNNSRDERSRSPGWDKDRTPERQGDATLSLGLSSLEMANEKEIPELPSSLAIYFREDLISHVKNLPGEGLERQANKLMEDLLIANSIQLSKVSSELKMARSLVRLTDIQATLQEQKILFLRQQIKDLEESDTSSGLGIEPTIT